MVGSFAYLIRCPLGPWRERSAGSRAPRRSRASSSVAVAREVVGLRRGPPPWTRGTTWECDYLSW